MSRMIKLDDASWHIDSAAAAHRRLDPKDPAEADRLFAYAGAHIALLLRWGLRHGHGPMIIKWNLTEEADAVAAGSLSGTAFAAEALDWKLFLEVFADPLWPFVGCYCDPHRGIFPLDVARQYDGDPGYAWDEAAIDFAAFARLVDGRRAQFAAPGRDAVRRPPWWRRKLGAQGPAPMRWRD